MRIMLTNDDGIDSIGLHVLARTFTALGDVVIVAPDREFSGAGASLGTIYDLRPEIHRHEIDGIDEAWSVSGPPALCALFGRIGLFGDLDLVVSGINPGANTGRAVYHSGTVGAAVTARNGGINAIAVSQSVEGLGVEGQGWGDTLESQRWQEAADVALSFATAMVAELPPDPVCVNLNVPNCAVDDMLGWRKTSIAALPPRAITDATLVPKAGHDGAFEAEIGWGEPIDLPIDTDSGAIEAGYVAVTYLSRYVDDDRPELFASELVLDDLLGAQR